MPDAAHIVFPDTARALQERFGSRRGYARRDREDGFPNEVTPDLAAFIGQVNSFYMATASRDGQPYIQHRGGPKGFLRVLGPGTLGFADYAGNKQYITAGNLSENPACHLFLMDYAHRQRIKIWGRARVVEDDAELLARVFDPAYRAQPERVIVIDIVAWDPNCRQHIPQKFDAADVAEVVERMQARIRELEAEVASLRAGSAAAPA